MDIVGRVYAGGYCIGCCGVMVEASVMVADERRIDLVISEDEREDVDCEIVLARM